MSKVRILFLGTPDFAAAALSRMLADEHFEIVGVVTQPDRPAGRKMQLKPSPVKELALAHQLKVFTPETVNTEEFRAEIAKLDPESAAVVAFGQILGQKFLDLFPRGCVNVHGSILPRWRGAAPIQRALMAGDQETGVALQVMVKKLDAGPVLGVRKLPIAEDMNALELHDRLKVLGADLLCIEYMDYLRGNLTPVPQDESQVTYASKIEKSESKIDWDRTAREICNHVRGLAMGPAAVTSRQGQALKIHKTKVIDDERVPAGSLPGQVVHFDHQTFHVACGRGILEILEVQPESRSRQPASEYMRGYPMQEGERLQ